MLDTDTADTNTADTNTADTSALLRRARCSHTLVRRCSCMHDAQRCSDSPATADGSFTTVLTLGAVDRVAETRASTALQTLHRCHI